jgi:prepilin peptidase CpaA
MIVAAIFVLFPFCMAYAAISDVLSMTIANRVSLLLVVAFMLLAPLSGMPWQDYAWHLGAGLAVLAVTFTLFAIGGMGGGDAKLLAATAVWMGFGPVLVEYMVYSAVFGGFLTIFILLYRRSPLSVFTGHNLFLRNLADRDVGVPYGIALGLGGLAAYPGTQLAQWALARAAGL